MMSKRVSSKQGDDVLVVNYKIVSVHMRLEAV